VTISNVATGVRRSTATDDRGRFLVPQLPPGSYELTVSLSGFGTLVRQGITLTVGQEASLTLPMQVGAVTEQVTVVGEAPLVNTATSSVAGIVEEKRIAELPLNGRDFTQLALIEPGVVSVRNSDQIATKGFGTRIAAAGSRQTRPHGCWMARTLRACRTLVLPGVHQAFCSESMPSRSSKS
jgi:hypothetical protein